ncbi:MAG TPA: cytochrome C [Chryseobacterium sp.]|uniref:Cytochrome C n=2 Tax=Kaistella TaxID=2782231 RepID=A0ABT3JL78_9FLAO|nr:MULTISPECIES: cytochrome C [Chryseobacterium group]MBV2166389.1 cytochrome C [Kaistella sp.]MCW4451466.1 cytochrome C [Kaistella yananensis]OWR15417.1 cytochrome C [Chryseobacterium sp. VAUSW3]HAI81660.1 cytochrome C [Chryseobacterium sp.]
MKRPQNFTRITTIFSAIAIIGFLTSCTTKPAVTEGTKTMTAENLALGKTLFDNSCGRCHDLPSPTSHSAQDWVGIMNAMAPKAKLNDQQHQLVYDYIVSVKK